ncbi:hypothetical protein AT2G02695 [Arabidopsis thaliana]|uniref:Uncharacterized protein n=1 Tax=Arabidopsis thaliana TaxID=3702 RepID=A0A1P8AZ47_ARATH|nr:uncharacterized protein AT2G02695 [Arabidopsis thaliana]ANM61897.1 hypothetical protein AT2G02695 [Arabidopsis thaliana]|eukprot:NP_001324086.1 hypothetical protein AT2G02695 [Arabidopsis thaliana]
MGSKWALTLGSNVVTKDRKCSDKTVDF